MNLNLFYSNFFVLLFSISILFGKALRPESNFKHLEILTKNNKHKEYFEITKDGLEYNVKGPAEIKIFSKAAFSKKTINKAKNFGFKISINEISTESNNFKKIDKKVFSPSHPRHVYTYPAKDIIVVPSGNYKIKIHKKSFFSPPILVRLLRSGRKSKKIVKEKFNIHGDFRKYTIKSMQNSSTSPYYVLDNSQPIFLNDTAGLFEFNLRGVHKYKFEDPDIIHASLIKNGKRDALYHILSIPHPSKEINQNKKIPGKLNKIYIKTDESNYLYNVLEPNSDLLVKMNKVIR